MNTHTPSDSSRWWPAAGVLLLVLLLGAGALAIRLAHSARNLSEPRAIASIEPSEAESSIPMDLPLPARPRDSGFTRSAAGTPAEAPFGPALSWRLESLEPTVGAEFPSGTLAVETRVPGGRWVSHDSLPVSPTGRIDFPATPSTPVEYRVTSLALDAEQFLVDDRGFAGESASEVVLRVDGTPRVAVYSRSTGEELRTVRIAQAAKRPPGATPAFDSPGPEGFQVGLRELSAPFDARTLRELDSPLVIADGCAWRAIPDRVLLAGGRVFLDPGHRVSVHVDASASVPAGGVEELSLQLMEEEVGRWGSSSLSVMLAKTSAPDGKLEGDFHFSGVPVPILSAAVEARWLRDASMAGGLEDSARGSGGLSREGDRVVVSLRPDAPEEVVEGYIDFADEGLAEQVTGVVLYAVGGAVHVDSLFARRLPLGKGLSVTDEGPLRWECQGLRPGRYAMLLRPLGIYCSLEVESTESGLQTLLSQVPPLVPVGVHLADNHGAIITAERSVGVTAFVAGAGAERPSITKPLEVVGGESSSPRLELWVPLGARCFVNISSAGRSAQGEFLAEAGALHEFRLQPEMRWITLRRTVPGGEAAAPLRWWQQNVYRLNERGEEEPIVYRTRALQGAPSRSAFTAWGLVHEREPTSELDVAIPAEAGILVIRGTFAGVGNEVIDVGAGASEVVLASY